MNAERRYALNKIEAGDYLLHGNDVEVDDYGLAATGTVFRLSRWEDGPHLGAERVRTVWTLSMASWGEARRTFESTPFGNPLNKVAWDHVEEFSTRSEAVEEAVRLSEARRVKVSP